MTGVDFVKREVRCSILYLGGRGAGKTANLDWIARHHPGAPADRGDWRRDGLALALGDVGGFDIHFHLWPVDFATHRLLNGPSVTPPIGGIVWVIDSSLVQPEAADEMLAVYREALAPHDLATRPAVMQLNKRDLASAASLAVLGQRFAAAGYPTFEAIASRGVGVLETFEALAARMLHALRQ